MYWAEEALVMNWCCIISFSKLDGKCVIQICKSSPTKTGFYVLSSCDGLACYLLMEL